MLACELFSDAAGFENTKISGISTNSQKTKKNNVFVCLKGETTDGHKHVEEAIKKGACIIVASEKITSDVPVVYVEDTQTTLAVLSRKFYNYPDKKLKLIGVTGTNGKTTVTFLIKSILEAYGKKTGVIGTNKCYLSNEELEFESNMPTTPDALELAQIFDTMSKKGAEYVVMEVSSHALALSRCLGLTFEVGVFTNLSRDHLDFHGTMAEYEAAKFRLFSQSEKGVFNTDNAAGLRMSDKCKCPHISVGFHDTDICATQVQLCADRIEFTVTEKDTEHTIILGIPGKFSVYNALCAIGSARMLGIEYETISAGLASVGNVKGRVELVPTNTDYCVFIDYAHSPDGLFNILSTARGFTRGRLIVLFGCGGDRDKTKRPIMGKIASELADFSIITSDNPRTENPISIIEDIKTGMDLGGGDYIIILNRREAIEYALTHAQKDDTILLCGKGQETYQIIGRKKYHFDEREIVAEILS